LKQKAFRAGGVTTSCRDLARFGQLWLHRGRWGSGGGGSAPQQEVFTEAFYQTAMTPNPRGSGSRRYHWGVNGDMHRATGMGDQFVAYDDVGENGIRFRFLYLQSDHFTKTGSGQT
jgi:CubicO group peptidase (beta-lactamase class C family)